MKFISSLLAGVCAGSVFAASTTIDSSNTMGVLRIEATASTKNLVPVPWTKLATDDEAIPLSDLVSAGQFEMFDMLNWLSYGSGDYTLSYWDDGAWQDATQTIPRGLGLWFTPQSNKTVWLIGQVPVTQTEIQAVKGAANQFKYTLFVNPLLSNVVLSDITEGCAEGDMIVLFDNLALTYRFCKPTSSSDGELKWCVQKTETKTLPVIGTCTITSWIPATITLPGLGGFWYYSAGGQPVFKW